MKFVFFSKTQWDEPPRLRHQLARMLAKRGHFVRFVEKPTYPWQTPTPQRVVEPQIECIGSKQLVHHRLRAHQSLTALNAWYQSRNLTSNQIISTDDVVINFCYDYGFLRGIAPKNKIIAVINDDFVGHLGVHMQRMAGQSLREAVSQADKTLAVSYPLVDQARQYGALEPELFMPWARQPYMAPIDSTDRDHALYWGSISSVMDLDLVNQILDKGIKLFFVGPQEKNPRIQAILQHPNVKVMAPAPLQDLSAVIARCRCSILPYDADNIQVQSITVNNRVFDLLSCGLPLLYRKLPHLIQAPDNVIYRCITADDFATAFAACANAHIDAQTAIQQFLKNHDEPSRYLQFMQTIRAVP